MADNKKGEIWLKNKERQQKKIADKTNSINLISLN
jgi:hypothetical protein